MYTARVDVCDNMPKPPSTCSVTENSVEPVRVIVVVKVDFVVVVVVVEVAVASGLSVLFAPHRGNAIFAVGEK